MEKEMPNNPAEAPRVEKLTFEKELEIFSGDLSELMKGENGDLDQNQKHDWLKLIYETYHDRFSRDNDKIWSVGNIFIPLSLVGLTSLKDLPYDYTIILGLGSVMLMLFWTITAENHRASQEASEAIMERITKHIGLEIPYGKLKINWFSKISIQYSRWAMLGVIIMIWGWAVYLASTRKSTAVDDKGNAIKISYNVANKTIVAELPLAKIDSAKGGSLKVSKDSIPK